MAVTRVTHSTRGFNAINYALKGKPHVKDKYISGRVLDASGFNCTVHGCRTEMNAVWKKYKINRPTKKHRRQVQRLIQSFDPNQLNYKNKKDIQTANAIGKATAKKLYPHRQSIVVTQADNHNHILHNHIITNMLDFRTGKSMSGNDTNWQYVQRVSDKVISKDFKLNPYINKHFMMTKNGLKFIRPSHVTDAEYHIKKNNHYSWVSDIRRRISLSKAKSANWSEFIAKCRHYGVVCDPFRKHKGSIRRDKNNNPVFKKHTSYHFNGKDGKLHRIRDRKLGLSFSKDTLTDKFKRNAKERKQSHDKQIKRSNASYRSPLVANDKGMEALFSKRSSSVTKPKPKLDYPTISLTMSQALPMMSTDKVRKSTPTIIHPILNTTVINEHKGIKEFHIISHDLDYTDNDVSIFHKLLSPFISGLRSTNEKIKAWTKNKLNHAKSAVRTYFHDRGWDKLIHHYYHVIGNKLSNSSDRIKNKRLNKNNTTTSSSENQIQLNKSSVYASSKPTKAYTSSSSINKNSPQFKMALKIAKGAKSNLSNASKLEQKDKATHSIYKSRMANRNRINRNHGINNNGYTHYHNHDHGRE